MTYAAAYDYLLSLLNVERGEYIANPRQAGIYLERMRALLKILGNPQKKIPHYVHITGTSGKGSVSRLTARVLQANGWRTGLLTSPHPSVILERFEINNQLMPRRAFTQLVRQLKLALETYITTSKLDVPSFGELLTIMGLMYFAENRVKYAVLEVGCGGRFDYTNVIPHKDVAVITNVGLDHTEILGDTKEKIAYEKAGIIKPGARVFTMDTNPTVLKVLERECRQTKTKLTRVMASAGRLDSVSIQGTRFSVEGTSYRLKAIGAHQMHNALLVHQVARSLGAGEPAIARGFKNTTLPICMEVVSRAPLILLDGAHNPDKIRSSVASFKRLAPGRPLHLLVGFAANKNIAAMVKILARLNPEHIICTRFTVNPFRKTADPRRIAALFKKIGQPMSPRTSIEMYLDPIRALGAGRRAQAKTKGTILCTGSIFLSGELRQKLVA